MLADRADSLTADDEATLTGRTPADVDRARLQPTHPGPDAGPDAIRAWWASSRM